MSNLSALDLSALLCSRVCHDVVGSVGAISNGLEVLDEENDVEMRQIAGDLVRKSAAQASAKLTFSRIAFGAAGSAGAEIDLDDARDKAEQMIAFEKANLVWDMPRAIRPKNEVKLLLNLILIALSAVPRGGNITVSREGENGLKLICDGRAARIPQHSELFETLPESLEGVDAHSVQPIYAALLADACNLKVSFSANEEIVEIRAV
ncbi:MAG: histidine phosphotransferase family protein [Hyphomicrobiales bacterium]